VGITAFVCALVAALLGLKVSNDNKHFADEKEEKRNPIGLKGAAKLSFFIFGLLAISALVKRTLGSEALMIVSFISGLFELHGVTYANAALFVSGMLTAKEATIALLLALLASFISKIGICWIMNFGKFAAVMTGYLMLVLSSGILTFVIVNYPWQ